MYYTSLKTAWEIEQGKFHYATGVWPTAFPYGSAFRMALDSGASGPAHSHLLNLARLNADLEQLARVAPSTHSYVVRKFRSLAAASRSRRTEVSAFRGLRFEALVGSHLAAQGYPPFVADDNPRVNQRQPDFLIEHAGTTLFVECGSLESEDIKKGKVRATVMKKAIGAQGVKRHVGPNAVLVLDVTNLVARAAQRTGEPVDLILLQREVMGALPRLEAEFGTTWGGVLLHIVGVHAEARATPSPRTTTDDDYAIAYLEDSVALRRLSWKHQLVARSFFGAVEHRSSPELKAALGAGFPTTRLNWTVQFEHLTHKLIY
jgi:hypothetical protein